MLLLFALCLLAKPALSVIGEVHFQFDVLDMAQAVTVQGGHAHGGAGGDEEGTDSFWHALVHAGHCCGHTPGTAFAVTVAVHAVPLGTVLPQPSASAPSSRTEILLRPPIRA